MSTTRKPSCIPGHPLCNTRTNAGLLTPVAHPGFLSRAQERAWLFEKAKHDIVRRYGYLGDKNGLFVGYFHGFTRRIRRKIMRRLAKRWYWQLRENGGQGKRVTKDLLECANLELGAAAK